MNFFESLKSPRTTWMWAFLISLIIIYPNVNNLLWTVFAVHPGCDGDSVWTFAGCFGKKVWTLPKTVYFIYRYLFFVTLTWLLIRMNVCPKTPKNFTKRFRDSFWVVLAAYAVYLLIGITVEYRVRLDCFTQLVILQFLIAWLSPVLIGQIYYLMVVQREKEREIEQLRTETLRSCVEALSNQINPHFFFNSLNGVTALVAAGRYEETTEYIGKLSGIFRYILQSEKKGLVSLDEELRFLEAYRYLIEVRYCGKIFFDIDIPAAARGLRMPVLSLLPLVENVIKHNVIDSDHRMTVTLAMQGPSRLAVSNPVYPKFTGEESSGIGLYNLAARYRLLTGSEIEITEHDRVFTVVLPLKSAHDESIDR